MALLFYYSNVNAYPKAFSFLDQESQQNETSRYYRFFVTIKVWYVKIFTLTKVVILGAKVSSRLKTKI